VTRGRRLRRLGWLVIGALVVVLALKARQYAPHIPLYLANLRLSAQLDHLPEEELGDRILIVAPHPDDETLGCGGLIQRARARGVDVHVVVITNGDAYAHDWVLVAAEDALRGTASEHLALGRGRQRESLRALATYGVPADHVTFLGYPDGGVHTMWRPEHWSADQPFRSPHTRAERNPYPNSLSPGAPYSGAQVLSDLQKLLETIRPTAVFVTPPFDVHRDHWATYGFVRLALAEWSRKTAGSPRLYCYLVHRHDWPAPQGYHPHRALEPPAAWLHRLGVTWLMLPLTVDQVRCKARCLSDYRSQDAQKNALLRSFARTNELFARVADDRPGSASVVITDPVGDLPPDRLRPAEDLAALRLQSQGDRTQLSLDLAARPDPRMTYGVIWHDVGDPERRAGSVLWHRGHAVLRVASANGSATESRVGWEVQRSGLAARLPGSTFHGSAMLIEAFSEADRHYRNHTMVGVVPFAIPGSPPAAGASPTPTGPPAVPPAPTGTPRPRAGSGSGRPRS
jgi:LmbE family N-acetylglucosaminyl deacetylase